MLDLEQTTWDAIGLNLCYKAHIRSKDLRFNLTFYWLEMPESSVFNEAILLLIVSLPRFILWTNESTVRNQNRSLQLPCTPNTHNIIRNTWMESYFGTKIGILRRKSEIVVHQHHIWNIYIYSHIYSKVSLLQCQISLLPSCEPSSILDVYI